MEPLSKLIADEPCPYEFTSGCRYDDCWFSHEEKHAKSLKNWECRHEKNNGKCHFLPTVGCGFRHKDQTPSQSQKFMSRTALLMIGTTMLRREDAFSLVENWADSLRKEKFDFRGQLKIDRQKIMHQLKLSFIHKGRYEANVMNVVDFHANVDPNQIIDPKTELTVRINVLLIVIGGSETQQNINSIIDFLKSTNISFNENNLHILISSNPDLLPEHIRSSLAQEPFSAGRQVSYKIKIFIRKSEAEFPQVPTLKEVFCLKDAHKDVITSISYGNFHLVSGSVDQSINVYTLESPNGIPILEKEKTLPNTNNNWIWSVAISPDGRFVTSGSVDTSIKVYDLSVDQLGFSESNEQINKIVRSVAISPDDKHIAAGSKSGFLHVLDIRQKFLVKKKISYGTPTVAFLSENLIASSCDDGKVKIFDLVGDLVCESEDSPFDGGFVLAAKSSSSGGFIVAAHLPCIKVYTYDAKEKHLKLHHSFDSFHNGPITTVAIYDQRFIISGSEDRSIWIYDFINKKHVCRKSNAHEGQVLSVAVTEEGFIISGSQDRSIKIFQPDWETFKNK